SEYEKELEEKKLKETKIEDIATLNKKMKKMLIDKGYTDVLSVLKATPDELKTLLSLDDEGVNELLEKLKPKKEEKPKDEDKEIKDAPESP
ncbi:MAG: hypothetical protein ABIL44_10980, partial [candidate division WOR-3 bacterium]